MERWLLEFDLPRVVDELPRFRTLYESPIVGVRDYDCRACRGGPTAEEYSETHAIVLLRRGAFCKHFGSRRAVVADANHAAFFSAGSSYRVSHPSECGDRGTVLVPAPCVLGEIVRELDPTVDDRPAGRFPFVTGPCPPGLFLRHRGFVQRLQASPVGSESLWADATALQLAADALEAAYARRGRPCRRRPGTKIDHRERVEAVKTYLASRLGERIALDEVARAAHLSPFHLARVFANETGLPIHRYLMRLRLRDSLERLADGADDLAALALDLGFSSHSHFTDSFRREFGVAPSAARRSGRLQALREMSKDLEV